MAPAAYILYIQGLMYQNLKIITQNQYFIK